jgi:hypothetical protein
MKRKIKLTYDPLTEKVQNLLLRIPVLGNGVCRFYLWQFMMFNFMIIGATGVILNFVLYEGFFRTLLMNLWGGTFLAFIITTTIVFLWNYLLNLKWSLNISAQIMKMKKQDLLALRENIDKILEKKFHASGSKNRD